MNKFSINQVKVIGISTVVAIIITAYIIPIFFEYTEVSIITLTLVSVFIVTLIFVATTPSSDTLPLAFTFTVTFASALAFAMVAPVAEHEFFWRSLIVSVLFTGISILAYIRYVEEKYAEVQN